MKWTELQYCVPRFNDVVRLLLLRNLHKRDGLNCGAECHGLMTLLGSCCFVTCTNEMG